MIGLFLSRLKSCHSKIRFKSLLKTHLMSQFFKDDVYLKLHCTCISVHNFVFAITVNCLYSCFSLFPRLEHPAGWICARYKSLILLLLLLRGEGVMASSQFPFHQSLCKLFIWGSTFGYVGS